MKVICVYNQLYGETREAILRYAPETEFCSTQGDAWTYWRTIGRFWGKGEDLVIIEQDIEIGPDTISSFEACNEPWCSFGYQIFPAPDIIRVDWALGCVKFGTEAQKLLPWGCVQHPWGGLDSAIAGWFNCHQNLQPHVHGVVRHHHDYPDCFVHSERQQRLGTMLYMPQPANPTDKYGPDGSAVPERISEHPPVLFAGSDYSDERKKAHSKGKRKLRFRIPSPALTLRRMAVASGRARLVETTGEQARSARQQKAG